MMTHRFFDFLRFIRFSHTVFALPFALGALFVAANGFPSLEIFFLVLLCMVFARTAAMTFNRIVDWKIDQKNPRTAGRHRLTTLPTAIFACSLSSLLFILTTHFINPLCFLLSPLALAIIFFYSLTKRFTSLAQFFLGLALAVAPVGAWIAERGTFDLPPLLLALGVLLWVAGFDMIYATQDVEIDKQEGLKSMVVTLGVPRALRWASILHGCAFLFFVAFGMTTSSGAIYFLGLAFILLALLYEHHVASQKNLERMNTAFFWSNAFVGAIFVLSTWMDRVI